MSKYQISWQTELTLKPGKLNDFIRLNEEMTTWAKTEPDTLVYERFISDDKKTVFVYEHYINSEAAIAHLQVFIEKYGQQFGAMIERKRFLVFGNPSDQLRAILDGFDATYCNSIGGFSKF